TTSSGCGPTPPGWNGRRTLPGSNGWNRRSPCSEPGRRRRNYTVVVAGLYRDRGIVLRSVKLGEADRIVTFLTEGRGKVRAVAKGVRKSKSRFGGRLEQTTRLFLQLYEGRNLDVVTQVETIDANRALRETYGAFTQAIAML